MIEYFKKIRYDFIEKNNPGKYLRYALGEIILVVIGILIAVSINNWNEEQKRIEQEHKILLSLRSDFLESRDRLLETMNYQHKVLQRSDALMKIYEGKVPMPVTDSIKLYLGYGAFAWYRAELVTGSYNALINTGNSELIKNDMLLKMLAEYYSILDAGFEDQQTSMNLINDMEIIAAPVLLTLSSSTLRARIGLDTIPNPREKEEDAVRYLFRQDAFFGHLYNKTIIEELRYSNQRDLMSRINKIIAVIDKELEPSDH